MKLQSLSKITEKRNRRVGRGHGSGRGKTAGRGTKGQRSRGKIPISFEGGALPLIKRLPFRKGKGKNRSFGKGPLVVNVKALGILKKGSVVNVATLIESRIVDANHAKQYGVKILGDGEIAIPLVVALSTSKGAAKKIEKAGGRVERLNE